MKHVCFTTAMEKEPLHAGVVRLLEAARNEEWTLHRWLGGERECPGIREKVARATAGRRAAAELLRQMRAGTAVDGCAEPVVDDVGGWERIHADAHHAMTDLLAELDATDEDTLAAEPGIRRDHPQYVWRDVVNHAVRGPFLDYAHWHHDKGRGIEAMGGLGRGYEAGRGGPGPTKAPPAPGYDPGSGP